MIYPVHESTTSEKVVKFIEGKYLTEDARHFLENGPGYVLTEEGLFSMTWGEEKMPYPYQEAPDQIPLEDIMEEMSEEHFAKILPILEESWIDPDEPGLVNLVDHAGDCYRFKFLNLIDSELCIELSKDFREKYVL